MRRTAAASALAADYLARDDAHRLTMLGTGALAPHLIEATPAFGRSTTTTAARRKKRSLWPTGSKTASPPSRRITDNRGIAAADIVSCATLSADPGPWR